MNAVSHWVRALAFAITFFAASAQAGGPKVICASTNAPIKFPGTGTINLNYDLGTLGTRSKAQAEGLSHHLLTGCGCKEGRQEGECPQLSCQVS